MNNQRQIIFHGNYFIDFYMDQNEKMQEKIEKEIQLALKLKNEYFELKKKNDENKKY